MNTTIHPIRKAAFLLFTFTFFISCKDKTETPKNYTGSMMFWQTKVTRDKYMNLGVGSNYKIFIRGKELGNLGMGVFWNIAPDCRADGAPVFDFELGDKKEETMQLQIRKQSDNDIIIDDIITVKNGVCGKYEIK
ncbi:MAG: hypothetical protein ACKVQB_12145 [Bacteroidia bacterium]